MKEYIFQPRHPFPVVATIFLIAFFALAYIRPGTPLNGDTTWQSEFLGVMLLLFLCVKFITHKTNWLFGLAVLYIVGNGVYFSYYKENLYRLNDSLIKSMTSNAASKTSLLLLLLTISLLLAELDIRRVRRWITAISLCNILLVFIKHIPGVENLRAGIPSGLIDVAGINAAGIAITMPAILSTINSKGLRLYLSLGAIGLCFLPVWLSGSSNAHGVFVVSLSVYLIAVFGIGWVSLLLSSIALVFTGGMGFYFLRNNFLNDSSRFDAYRSFMGYWYKSMPFFTGAGLGSFSSLSVPIQLQTGYNIDIAKNVGVFFFHLHSDWLQILFETGAIGLILSILVFTYSALRFRRCPAEFTMLVSTAAFMVFYYPLHWFHTGLLAAYLLVKANRNDSPTVESPASSVRKSKVPR